MFIYQEQHGNTSGILIIQVDLGEYQMTYHHMQQHEREIVSFSQNRIPSNDERGYIAEWTERQFEQQRVMNLFRDSFRNCMNQTELQFVH